MTDATLIKHSDGPIVGGVLIMAGFVQTWFTSAHLQEVYLLLLIPPTAYHCYAWFKKSVVPVIKKLANRDLYSKSVTTVSKSPITGNTVTVTKVETVDVQAPASEVELIKHD